MLTGYSTWYAPYTGRIRGKTHIPQIQGAIGMTGISPFAHKSLDPNNPVHLHPSAGLYQTFVDGNYISMPFPHYIPQSILNWRWDNIKKNRAQFYKTQQYVIALQTIGRTLSREEVPAESEISEEYAGYHKPHTGYFLNINA